MASSAPAVGVGAGFPSGIPHQFLMTNMGGIPTLAASGGTTTNASVSAPAQSAVNPIAAALDEMSIDELYEVLVLMKVLIIQFLPLANFLSLSSYFCRRCSWLYYIRYNIAPRARPVLGMTGALSRPPLEQQLIMDSPDEARAVLLAKPQLAQVRRCTDRVSAFALARPPAGFNQCALSTHSRYAFAGRLY